MWSRTYARCAACVCARKGSTNAEAPDDATRDWAARSIQCSQRARAARAACARERAWCIRLAFARAHAWACARDRCAARLQRAAARRALRVLARCTAVLDDANNASAPSLISRVETLVEDYDRVKRSTECVVCWKSARCVVTFPCHHLATCLECVLRLDECCICRASIDDHSVVYVV